MELAKSIKNRLKTPETTYKPLSEYYFYHFCHVTILLTIVNTYGKCYIVSRIPINSEN